MRGGGAKCSGVRDDKLKLSFALLVLRCDYINNSESDTEQQK